MALYASDSVAALGVDLSDDAGVAENAIAGPGGRPFGDHCPFALRFEAASGGSVDAGGIVATALLVGAAFVVEDFAVVAVVAVVVGTGGVGGAGVVGGFGFSAGFSVVAGGIVAAGAVVLTGMVWFAAATGTPNKALTSRAVVATWRGAINRGEVIIGTP
jgi:hypothetical protein